MIRKLLVPALLVMCLPLPVAAVTIDGIAATVNGEVITIFDLEKAGKPTVDRALLSAPPQDREKVKREVLRSILDQLVLISLQKQRARKLEMKVSDGEVDAAISNIMKNNNLEKEMLEKALEKEGMTMAAYRERISEQILFSRLMQHEIRNRITVTPREVDEYYGEHKEEYFQPEQIRVRHLLVKASRDSSPEEIKAAGAKAEKILEEFRGGADFVDLIKRHSPDTFLGGDSVSAWLKRGEFLGEIESVAFSIPEGSVSEPIRSMAGFHLIQLVEKKEALQLSREAVADSITEKLSQSKMEKGYAAWLEELRKDSQVQILY